MFVETEKARQMDDEKKLSLRQQWQDTHQLVVSSRSTEEVIPDLTGDPEKGQFPLDSRFHRIDFLFKNPKRLETKGKT